MICGYQDRTFRLGVCSKMSIKLVNENAKPYKLTGFSFGGMQICNIHNNQTKDIEILANSLVFDSDVGNFSFEYKMPNFDENDDFFEKDKYQYSRGELLYSYSVNLTKNNETYTVLRGLCRLVRIAK